MKKLKVILLSIVIGYALFLVVGILCSEFYMRNYIKQTYPDCTIVKDEIYGGSFSLFGSSDIDKRYKVYTLHDDNYDFEFKQTFSRLFYLPVYSDYTNKNKLSEHDSIIENIVAKAELKQGVSDIVSIYCKDFIYIENPADFDRYGNVGCHIYIKDISDVQLEEVIQALDNYVREMYSVDKTRYFTYSLNICKDAEFFKEMQDYDVNKLNLSFIGQAYFEDMLVALSTEYNVQRISTERGFNAVFYNDLGDVTDEEYKNPEDFEHLVFWYDGEPNAFRRGNFFLFGLNHK